MCEREIERKRKKGINRERERNHICDLNYIIVLDIILSKVRNTQMFFNFALNVN